MHKDRYNDGFIFNLISVRLGEKCCLLRYLNLDV